MPFKNGIEHRAKLDGAAAHVESLDLKGHNLIVTGKIELAKSRRCFCHRLLLASTMITRIDSIRDVAMTHSKNCMRDADGNRSLPLHVRYGLHRVHRRAPVQPSAIPFDPVMDEFLRRHLLCVEAPPWAPST
ncbi:hypothetical protein Q1M64_18585 [Sinorhizobium meliloti]|nr:hypothetical protein Q1M64_18585 [Sinorhizobium meliloti]